LTGLRNRGQTDANTMRTQANPLVFVAVLSVGATGLLACGGGDDNNLSTVDLFCAAKADKECQVADLCLASKEACRAARKVACTSFAASAQSDVRKYNAKNAQSCVDKTASVYGSKGTISVEALTELDELCARVFTGNKASLDPCTSSCECDGKLICDKGKCADRVEKKAGALCGNPGEVCESGAYCVADMGGTFQCQKKKAKSEMCDAAAPCLETLRCQGGTCVDRLGIGEACMTHDDCGPTGPYCNPWLGKCASGLNFAEGAAACAGFGGAGDGGGNDAGGGSDAGADTGSGGCAGDAACDGGAGDTPAD